ncbi:MAG TPA: HAD family hydrolase [Methylomirabilota bacterium]|jgi:putative hydrolase of the HAD superfamily
MDFPRAVLLDLDDTLLDYSGGVDVCWRESCVKVAGPGGIDGARLAEAVFESRRWFWDDPERHRRERVDMLGAWTKIVAHALEKSGVAADGLAGAIAEEYAARRRAAMCLFPEARACLERLRARGLPLGLVTNGDARQQRDKIERHDLARFFEVIVIEGEFGTGKPDPRVYQHALSALRTPAAQAWMVGDHLEFDVGGAQRVGVHGVWLDRAGQGLPPGSSVRPARIIGALDALLSE